MDKTVTRDQMNTILEGRPKGVSGKEIIDTYIANGYKVEGINYEKPKPTMEKVKDVAVGAAKGLGRTALDVGQNLQTIGQGAMLASGVSPETVSKTGFQSLDANSPTGKVIEQKLAPTNADQKLGGQIETGAELAIGGGAGLIKDAVVGGTKLLTKGVSKVAPTIKNAGESAYKSGFTPNTKEAELIQAYEASQPSLSSKLYGNGNIVGNPTFKPTLRSDSALRAGISGTEKQIGKQAKASADNIWNKEIAPAVESSPVRITKDEMFAPVEERIAKTIDPSRKQALMDALDAVKEDYKAIKDFSIKDAQSLKSSLDEFTPSKMFKGKDVANELKVVQHDMANAIRSKTYDSLADVNIKQKYLDYGNLKELEKVGIKAISEGGFKGGFGGFWSSVYDAAMTPVKTIGGKTLYRIGDKLEVTAPKSFKGKTLRDYLESVGYLIPQVGEKAISSDLQ